MWIGASRVILSHFGQIRQQLPFAFEEQRVIKRVILGLSAGRQIPRYITHSDGNAKLLQLEGMAMPLVL